METLGNILEPYSETIAKIAGTITCLHFLSGFTLINDIRKQGISDPYPIGPFLGGIVLTSLSLKYGSLIGDPAMFNVNLIGFIINAVFMAVFYWYASLENKSKLWNKFGIAGVFTGICLIYATFEDTKLIEFRFGMLITTILVILVGSPLLGLKDIIRKQSTEGLPFPIILAGTIVSISWMIYGVSIKNDVLAYQNAFLLFLGGIQLSLFAIYPNTPTEKYSRLSSPKKNRSSPTKAKTEKKNE